MGINDDAQQLAKKAPRCFSDYLGASVVVLCAGEGRGGLVCVKGDPIKVAAQERALCMGNWKWQGDVKNWEQGKGLELQSEKYS